MNILIESVVTLAVLVYGYILMHAYAQEKSLRSVDWKKLKPQHKEQIIFIVLSLLICIVSLVLLHVFYKENTLLHNLRRLSLIAFLIPVAAIDFKMQKIPNMFIGSALIFRVVLYVIEAILNSQEALYVLKDCALGALIISSFFLLISLVVKNSIGMGDIKLFMVMGLYQGMWGTMNSVFFSLVASFFVSIFLLITKKKNKKDAIPFGPSILVGTVVGVALSGM